jgi:hypothetical protein
MTRKVHRPEPAPGFSWADTGPDTGARLRPEIGPWARRLEHYSWFDAFVAAVAVAVVDLAGMLIVSGWQTAACGEACGLRTQLHLMHVAAAWTLAVLIPLPLLVALLARKGRVAIAAVQLLFCLGVVINAVSTEHRLVPRIEGTAHCWNSLYSDAECPWGPKD